MKKILFILTLLLIPHGVFASTKYESYAGGFYVGSYQNAYVTSTQFAQPFTAMATHTVTSIKVAIFRNGYPSPGGGGYDFLLNLYAADANHKPTGSSLANGFFASANGPSTDTASGTPYEFVLNNEITLATNTEYVFVISASSSAAFSASNYGSISTYNAGTLPAANSWITSNGGSTWSSAGAESALFEVWGNPVPVKWESYAGGYYVGSYQNAYAATHAFAQPFTASATHTVTSIKVAVWRNGYPSGGSGGYDFLLNLYAADGNHKPTGSSLANGSFASANSPTNATSNGTPYEFVLNNEVSLASSTEYVFVISAPNASAPSNYGSIHTYNSGTLPAANAWYTINGGSSWQSTGAESALFEVWGN